LGLWVITTIEEKFSRGRENIMAGVSFLAPKATLIMVIRRGGRHLAT
jgi:hypothetical protein